MATRAQITVNGVAGSDDDVTLAALVQLNNEGLGDETTYLWTILSQPSPMDVVLSSTTVQAPTFTPNKEGSYLVQLVVNKDLPDQKIDQVVVAVRELETRNRIPAAGETTENNAETGWANTAVDQILQRVTRFTDEGVIVGKAGQADLQPFDVVYTEDVTTIATGLPGEREVPLWRRATAATAGEVLGLLGVFINGVDGSTSPATGDIIRVAVLKILQAVQLGTAGVPRGTPIYVDNAGHLSLTPGDTIRQVGTTLDDMGSGAYGIWVTGEGTFGTIQGVSATAPLQVAEGVIPALTLGYTADFALESDDLALSATGVTPETYGEVDPAADESLISSVTVDAKGRITAASEGAVHIGGTTAKVYVDAGDATTLAAAEAYTDARTFGLSSKVPVHTGTTIPLPACTVNGTFQTLTANVHGPLLPVNTDGHDLLVGERLLVKDQVAQANNGIYVLTQKGATSGPSSPWILTRADDANTAAELCGSLVTVNVGNTLAGTAWLFAFNPTAFTLGTTPVVWSQFNAVPATDAVLGTVRLQGGLGGLGSTALTPILSVGTGNVSGTLPIANGGTGLTSAGVTEGAVLAATAGGLFEMRTAFGADACLAGVISAPIALQANYNNGNTDRLEIRRRTGSAATYFQLRLPTSQLAIIQPGASGSDTKTLGASITVEAESGVSPSGAGGNAFVNGGTTYAATGGNAYLTGGRQLGAFKAPAAYLRGGEPTVVGFDGGDAYVLGGVPEATGGGAGGDVYVQGGAAAYGETSQTGGDVNVFGGEAGVGGDVIIKGGRGRNTDGGDVFIDGGQSASPGVTGNVYITSAYINGAGDVGQVFTSNGTGARPSWQDLGGAAGPAARGAYKSVTSPSTYSALTTDYLIVASSSVNQVVLPSAASVPTGRIFLIKNNRSSGTLTISAQPGDTIGGGPTSVAVNDKAQIVRTDGGGTGVEWMWL